MPLQPLFLKPSCADCHSPSTLPRRHLLPLRRARNGTVCVGPPNVPESHPSPIGAPYPLFRWLFFPGYPLRYLFPPREVHPSPSPLSRSSVGLALFVSLCELTGPPRFLFASMPASDCLALCTQSFYECFICRWRSIFLTFIVFAEQSVNLVPPLLEACRGAPRFSVTPRVVRARFPMLQGERVRRFDARSSHLPQRKLGG